MFVGQSNTSPTHAPCYRYAWPGAWFISTASSRSNPLPFKLFDKVAPKYPRELKQNAIGGVVRLSISISPNGSVGKISPIGGNPILVDAATLAVKQWKYVPADHPTTAEVQLDFIPNRD